MYSYFIRALKDPLVWFYVFSWFLIRWTRSTGDIISFLNNWLTDFVFIPLICWFTQVFLLSLYRYRQVDVKFALWHILVLSTFVSFVFEYLAPKVTSYNTSDYIDVFFYYLGGLFYYYVHQDLVLKRWRKNKG